MKNHNIKPVIALLAAAMILTACGTNPTPNPTPTSGTAPVAQIPPENLVLPGKLLICTDIPYPPQEFYDEAGNPAGVDIEIGQAIADRLGLEMQVVNSVFDTIIAAVTSGKCDIIISAMNITPDRNKQVSMIPYFQAGQSIVVAKGNPSNIAGPLDLCGLGAAAESGTTEAQFLLGSEAYQDNGLTQQCQAEGKDPPKVVITQKDTDALQQLQTGKVAAYFTDSPVAGYYVTQNPDQFEVVGQIIEPIVEGIALPCGAEDCASAPLTPVGLAVQAALEDMFADGTYQDILARWNLATSAVNP